MQPECAEGTIYPHAHFSGVSIYIIVGIKSACSIWRAISGPKSRNRQMPDTYVFLLCIPTYYQISINLVLSGYHRTTNQV